MNGPLLSICIPCYGRIDYVRKTLHSIFVDNSTIPLCEYEVVISDNDPKQEIKALIEEYKDYSNLKYYHTKCEGFMNSYYVLTYAKGKFLKLHNSQTLFKKGALQYIINEIKRQQKEQTIIFYTNGLLNNFKSVDYSSFEEFMYHLSYWSSWSNGFNIWKKDFDQIGEIKLNKLFPHTSLFLTQYKAQKFCINDMILFDIQRIPKRGGHNKFQAFTIEYPSLIDECYKNKLISEKCKMHILRDILFEFLPSLIFNKYIARIETFDATGFKTNLKKYFPSYAYPLVYTLSIIQPIKLIIRKIRSTIHV